MRELKEVYSSPKLGYFKEQSADGKSSILKFRGPFQEMNDIRDNKNKNGRVYGKKLWERVLNDQSWQERLKSKRVVGELDHPSDDGQIRRTSHIVTNVWPDYNEGIVYGELEILNHDQGDAALLKALVEQGVQLCVSSRGFGDFLKDGCTVDPESYKLVTWDIVLDPSVPIATLNKVAESVNQKLQPESRARSGFMEVGRGGFDESEKTNQKIQEDEVEAEIKSLMETNKNLEITQVRTQTQLESMKKLVDDKNEALSKNEKKIEEQTERIEELETAQTKATGETKKLQEELDVAKATLKEYEGIEEKAISEIENLRGVAEKVEHYEDVGERGADTIENLLAENELLLEKLGKAKKVVEALQAKLPKSKKNEKKKAAKKEDGGADLDKIDKSKDAAGDLRAWEPGVEEAESPGTEDDPIGKKQGQQDEEDDPDKDKDKDGVVADEDEGGDDDDDPDKDQEEEAGDEDPEGKDKDKDEEEEDPEDPEGKDKEKGEGKKVSPMMSRLAEATLRDLSPAKKK